VSPCDLMRQATVAGIDLYSRGGGLILESPPRCREASP